MILLLSSDGFCFHPVFESFLCVNDNLNWTATMIQTCFIVSKE